MKNLPVIAQVAGFVTFLTGGIMMFVQLLNAVGFQKMIMSNGAGFWFESFKADAGYSMIIIAVIVTGLALLLGGRVAQSMQESN